MSDDMSISVLRIFLSVFFVSLVLTEKKWLFVLAFVFLIVSAIVFLLHEFVVFIELLLLMVLVFQHISSDFEFIIELWKFLVLLFPENFELNFNLFLESCLLNIMLFLNIIRFLFIFFRSFLYYTSQFLAFLRLASSRLWHELHYIFAVSQGNLQWCIIAKT